MKRKTRDENPDPFIHALGSARLGDVSGVHEMFFIFGQLCEQLTVLGGTNPAERLPPLVLMRISSIGKECKSLSEFANGWARGAASAKKP